MKTRSLVGFAALLVVLFITASAVFAGTAAFSGDFTGSSTMPVVLISTPNCVGQGATPVRYDAFPFSVTVTGSYNFQGSSTGGGDIAMYIMNSSFNPAAAFPNCINASNSDPHNFNVNLTAGTTYYLVLIDDTFDQLVTGYTVNTSGPGDFVGLPPAAGGTAAACTVALPSGASIRNVPLGAPAYHSADAGALLTWSLPAGNWWVGQTSGDFAQVWIACQANMIWIPVTALGG